MQSQLGSCKVCWLLLIAMHPDQQCCRVPAGLRKQHSCCSQAPCRITISTNSWFSAEQTSVPQYRSGPLWLLHSAGSVSETLPFVELLWLCLFTVFPSLLLLFSSGVRGSERGCSEESRAGRLLALHFPRWFRCRGVGVGLVLHPGWLPQERWRL